MIGLWNDFNYFKFVRVVLRPIVLYTQLDTSSFDKKAVAVVAAVLMFVGINLYKMPD